MSTAPRVPDATVYRLSLYHCFLGELQRAEGIQRITSGRLAEELDVKEETVRRDLSFVGGGGRPGAGYESDALLAALQEFLGLKDEYPILTVGSAQMIEALGVLFPSAAYGVLPVAYFSEQAADLGKRINGIQVRFVEDIPDLDPSLDVKVALVACSPPIVQHTLDLLRQAGVTGVLLLTPAVKLDKPEGMRITHVRMPCDIKSIACRCQPQFD